MFLIEIEFLLAPLVRHGEEHQVCGGGKLHIIPRLHDKHIAFRQLVLHVGCQYQIKRSHDCLYAVNRRVRTISLHYEPQRALGVGQRLPTDAGFPGKAGHAA